VFSKYTEHMLATLINCPEWNHRDIIPALEIPIVDGGINVFGFLKALITLRIYSIDFSPRGEHEHR
jgi:hypothetical protein